MNKPEAVFFYALYHPESQTYLDSEPLEGWQANTRNQMLRESGSNSRWIRLELNPEMFEAIELPLTLQRVKGGAA